MVRALCAGVVGALLLGGCAQLRPMPTGATGAGGFDMTGRVAVRYGNESSPGRVQWRHSEAADDLLITNPLGQGVARITRDAKGVELQTAQGRTEHAPDAETLTERVLGWRLPLEGLPYWIRGQARPERPSQSVRDDAQRLRELRQDDWKVEYEEYAGERPARLHLTRPDLDIRLIIESWQADTP